MTAVVITDATFPDVAAERVAASAANVDFVRAACRTADEVAHAVKGARVAVVQFAPFGPEAAAVMARGGRVIRYGVGYNNLDLESIRRNGLSAAYVPDYCTHEVADHTAALILTLLRKIIRFDVSVRNGQWDVQGIGAPMPPLSETTIGFLGFGRIARAVASRLSGFGFNFIACDPVHLSMTGGHVVDFVDELTLLARADVLSLHAPATKETIGFLNRDRLAQMKGSAFIVNSARGDLVDEIALSDALERQVIAGAALDVFSSEPLRSDSPLRLAPNVILSPHAAWYSETAVHRLQTMVADEISRALEGRPARQPVPGFLTEGNV